jgi:hypothetical protein
LNHKEIGQLTFRQFFDLYQAYKDQFDLELCLRLNWKTFQQAEADQLRSEEWF